MYLNMNKEDKIKLIAEQITKYPNFPKPDIVFRDICGVFRNPEVVEVLQSVMIDSIKHLQIDYIAALGARGFLLGPLLALHLKVPFIPIRKKGKLPGNVIAEEYELEYGKDAIEIQKNSFTSNGRVLIVDDLLATGGTLQAACKLVQKNCAQVTACLVAIELTELEGRKKVPSPVISIVEF